MEWFAFRKIILSMISGTRLALFVIYVSWGSSAMRQVGMAAAGIQVYCEANTARWGHLVAIWLHHAIGHWSRGAAASDWYCTNSRLVRSSQVIGIGDAMTGQMSPSIIAMPTNLKSIFKMLHSLKNCSFYLFIYLIENVGYTY